MKPNILKVLAACICLFLLAGCAGQPSSTQAAEASAATETAPSAASTAAVSEAPKSEEPETPEVSTLKILLRERWAGITYDNLVNNYIQEQTATKWDLIVAPGSEFVSKVNLQFASGDIPDIMNLPADDAYTAQLGEDGMLLAWDEHTDKLPNLLKQHGEGFEMMKDANGKIYSINGNVNNSSNGVDFLPLYRKD